MVRRRGRTTNSNHQSVTVWANKEESGEKGKRREETKWLEKTYLVGGSKEGV